MAGKRKAELTPEENVIADGARKERRRLAQIARRQKKRESASVEVKVQSGIEGDGGKIPLTPLSTVDRIQCLVDKHESSIVKRKQILLSKFERIAKVAGFHLTILDHSSGEIYLCAKSIDLELIQSKLDDLSKPATTTTVKVEVQ